MNHPQISYLNFKDNKSVRITGIAKKLENQKKWIDLMFDENKYRIMFIREIQDIF